MENNKENISFNFEGLLYFLKQKYETEIGQLRGAISENEISLRKSEKNYEKLKVLDYVSKGLSGAFVFGIFLLSFLTFKVCHDSYYSLMNDIASRNFLNIILFSAGTGIGIGGVASAKNFENIANGINSFFDKIIVNPTARSLDRKKAKTKYNNSEYNEEIAYNEHMLKEIEEMRENFKYLIHSSLKNKTFTEKEANQIYKLLEYNDIVSVIYYLYHDDLKTLKKMDDQKERKIAEKLRARIEMVKEYNEQIQLEQKKKKESEEPVRNRRIERLHTYPYDDMIKNYDDVFQNHRRK